MDVWTNENNLYDTFESFFWYSEELIINSSYRLIIVLTEKKPSVILQFMINHRSLKTNVHSYENLIDGSLIQESDLDNFSECRFFLIIEQNEYRSKRYWFYSLEISENTSEALKRTVQEIVCERWHDIPRNNNFSSIRIQMGVMLFSRYHIVSWFDAKIVMKSNWPRSKNS